MAVRAAGSDVPLDVLYKRTLICRYGGTRPKLAPGARAPRGRPRTNIGCPEVVYVYVHLRKDDPSLDFYFVYVHCRCRVVAAPRPLFFYSFTLYFSLLSLSLFSRFLSSLAFSLALLLALVAV
jgi:hypothetical protein